MTTIPCTDETARRPRLSLRHLSVLMLIGIGRLAIALSLAAALGLSLINAVVDAIVYTLAAMLALFFSCCGTCNGKLADASPMSASDVGSPPSVAATLERRS